MQRQRRAPHQRTVGAHPGSDLGGDPRVISDADVRLHRWGRCPHWSVVSTPRGKEHNICAQALEELGDYRRASWRGDDDQNGVRGRVITALDAQPGPLQLPFRVAPRPIENPRLRSKSGAVGRGQSGAEADARKRANDVIGNWRNCNAGAHGRIPIGS
jgi:hypothetical protein